MLGAIVVGVSACWSNQQDGTTSDKPLDCAWLTSDNCWKTLVKQAATCLPPGGSSSQGELNADGGMCSYANGAKVTFTPPLTLPPPAEPAWNVTVTDGNGQTCMHYEASANAVTLVVGGQTYTETPNGSKGVTVTCPDGIEYSNADRKTLTFCGTGNGPPGNVWSAGDSYVNLVLTGVASTPTSVFDCFKP